MAIEMMQPDLPPSGSNIIPHPSGTGHTFEVLAQGDQEVWLYHPISSTWGVQNCGERICHASNYVSDEFVEAKVARDWGHNPDRFDDPEIRAVVLPVGVHGIKACRQYLEERGMVRW